MDIDFTMLRKPWLVYSAGQITIATTALEYNSKQPLCLIAGEFPYRKKKEVDVSIRKCPLTLSP